MKRRKIISKFYSITSLFLCVLLVFSVLALVSCQTADPADADVTEVTEELKKVVRVKKGILSGKQISGDNLEIVDVPVSGIPEGAIDSIEAVVGKYATINMVMGEYVFERMLTSEAPVIDESLITYIVVSDRIENANGKDITAELQALIDSHPGRTIYFNDGNYTISSTVYIPADKEKAVSLRLSNYAVIKAAEGWNAETAMIAVGAKNEAASAEQAANAVMGGCLDGAGVAKIGLSLENCANTFVSNMTFKNLKTSISIKQTADSVNLEGVTVNGSGEGSVGIVNESSRSVFSTINMANVSSAVKNSGKDNNFRNISAACAKPSAESVGFYEAGENSIFELCTAQDFTCGYFIKDGVKSVFEACNAYWTKADATVQNAFVADGTFNSVIVGGTARFFDESSENAYIKLNTRGSGLVKVPIFDETLCDDKSYKTILAGSVILIK